MCFVNYLPTLTFYLKTCLHLMVVDVSVSLVTTISVVFRRAEQVIHTKIQASEPG